MAAPAIIEHQLADLVQTVNKADTTTSLAASVNPSVFGQPIYSPRRSLRWPRAPARPPHGRLQGWRHGAATNCAQCRPGRFHQRRARSRLTHYYSRLQCSSSFNGSDDSASPLTQTVKQGHYHHHGCRFGQPIGLGQAVTFTATVNAVSPGTGTRTGTVQFKLDGSDFGAPVSLSGVAPPVG